MTTSQQFIPIQDVNKDLVFQKDGSVGIIISVSAVNFALLFETEQISIIDSFAGLLNSLSFPIQIVIYSKIMDVSSYLHTIDNALAKQTNPNLKKMTLSYRGFVEKSIKDNNVLDKKFYVCIKLTSLELGLLPSNMEEKTKKVATLLEPRRDHLIRQLERLGLKAKQLSTEEIIKLFYEIYNPPITASVALPVQSNIKSSPLLEINKPEVIPQTPKVEDNLPPKLRPIRANLTQQVSTTVVPPAPTPAQAPITPPVIPKPPTPVAAPLTNLSPITAANLTSNASTFTSPFVVEELPDDGP
ncbi:MAG: hypothetical protein PHQ59_00785 [Candidatus Daviesbacteria bacterium]|nr:hypothetical protein [Candidatus Daviesbacteria bacterium]